MLFVYVHSITLMYIILFFFLYRLFPIIVYCFHLFDLYICPWLLYNKSFEFEFEFEFVFICLYAFAERITFKIGA